MRVRLASRLSDLRRAARPGALRVGGVALASAVALTVAVPAVQAADAPATTAAPTSTSTATVTPAPTATPSTPKPAAVTPPRTPVYGKGLTTVTTAGGTKLVLPLVAKKFSISSWYGARCIPTVGASTFHYGLDLSAPDGTAIYAVAAGTVAYAVNPKNGEAGYVAIRSVVDGRTVYFAYLHMWTATKWVRVGQTVAAGQRIADVGASGPASGPHLHLEVWQNAYWGSGTPTNPVTWLTAHGIPVVSLASKVTAVATPTTCTYYSTARLNLRTGPSTATKSVTVLPANAKLVNKPGVMTSSFIPVTYTTPAGKKLTGWVHSSYIRQFRTYHVTKATVLRSRAASTAPKLATLKAGAAITWLGPRSGAWTHVTVGGRTGWMVTTLVGAGL